MAETNSEEKVFLTLSAIGGIFGFIIPLIMWVLKKDEFSDYTKTFLTDILNFEIVLLIICIALTFVPVIGWLANMGLWLFNLIIMLRLLSASQEQKEYSLPIKYQIIK